MAWYDNAVFYHIYPLGLCGCPQENKGEEGSCFDKLYEWAAHARRLKASAIYIGPLFEAETHGYDTIDYRRVDRRLGTNEDFRDFVRRCHEIGLRVIVDGVFNHTGRRFFAFEDIRKNREGSGYRDWYCNVNFWGNNEFNDGFSYDNWGGHNQLAKLNLWNQEVKDYHFDTVRFWVHEFDIDGIRLDAADVLDFGFMHDLRNVCDGLKPDFWLMGEVIHGDYSRWANEGMLHSVTNYELHKALYSGHNDHNYFEIAHSVKRLMGITGDRIRLYTFADNHDVSRIRSKLNQKEHIYNVALLLYMIPGIPSLYYGSEFGIEGEKIRNQPDWNLRPCLELADFDEEAPLPALLSRLGSIKENYPEASYGDYRELLLTNRQFAFARTLDGRSIVTAVNNDDAPAHLEIGLPIAAGRAVNLLAVPDPSEEEKAAGQEEKIRRRQEHKDRLQEIGGQLLGAAGEIRDRAHSVREETLGLDVRGEDLAGQISPALTRLKAAMENMERVFAEYEKCAGAKVSAEMEISADCETFEIRDGRMIVDLPANRGIIACLTD